MDSKKIVDDYLAKYGISKDNSLWTQNLADLVQLGYEEGQADLDAAREESKRFKHLMDVNWVDGARLGEAHDALLGALRVLRQHPDAKAQVAALEAADNRIWERMTNQPKERVLLAEAQQKVEALTKIAVYAVESAFEQRVGCSFPHVHGSSEYCVACMLDKALKK